MKKALILCIFFVLTCQSIAQTKSETIPILVGFMGHAALHPGIKIGTRFNLKSWNREAENLTKVKSLYISPQMGIYTYPNVHTGYLVNADIGYRRIKSHKQKYSAFSIGFGFLNQSQLTNVTVNLNDGSKDKNRVNWGWFLPTLNYEFGKAINERIGGYGKLSYGYKMSFDRENASTFLIELGVSYTLKKNNP